MKLWCPKCKKELLHKFVAEIRGFFYWECPICENTLCTVDEE